MSRSIFGAILLIWTALLAACTTVDGHSPTLADAKALQHLIGEVGVVQKQLLAHPELAGTGKGVPVPTVLTAEQRKLLLSWWAPHLDHDRALESYQVRFLYGWQTLKTPAEQTRALAVGLAALAAQVQANLDFVVRYGRVEAAYAVLNDAALDVGVSAGEFERVLVTTAKPQTMLMLTLGVQALQRHIDRLRTSEAIDATFLELANQTLTYAQTVQTAYDKAAPRLLASAISTVTQNPLDAATAALVEHIAEWLGDTRLRKRTASLISAAQVDWLATQLQPGDVMVERRNWYLSNLGLPGFWPHAELFVGDPAALAAAFDQDPQVRDTYGPGGLTGYLQSELPSVWAAYVAMAEDGRPHRVIEAVSEGVVFSSLHEAAQADYLGAMRPRLSALDKARAIAAAFAQYGKPYDFDFDFLTQSTLVCSELVYVAYQTLAPKQGLNLPLTEVMGRETLPPTDFVRVFDQQYGTAAQQLDFVAFLDGRESSGTAVVATEAALRASWQRPKWDLAQQ